MDAKGAAIQKIKDRLAVFIPNRLQAAFADGLGVGKFHRRMGCLAIGDGPVLHPAIDFIPFVAIGHTVIKRAAVIVAHGLVGRGVCPCQ